MNFLFEIKNNASSSYLDFCVFGQFTNFKYIYMILSYTVLYIRSYIFACLFRILSSIKTNLTEKLVQLMINISNLLSTLLWGWKTSFRPVYNFDKMAIYDLPGVSTVNVEHILQFFLFLLLLWMLADCVYCFWLLNMHFQRGKNTNLL